MYERNKNDNPITEAINKVLVKSGTRTNQALNTNNQLI